MRSWAQTGRPLAEFWSLTLREVALVLEGHADAHWREIEMAHYLAWHVAAFSRPTRSGRMPDFEETKPRRRKPGAVTAPDEARMKSTLMNLTAALGGTIRKKGM